MADDIELRNREDSAYQCPGCGHRIAVELSDPYEAAFIRCIACDEYFDHAQPTE